MGLIRERLVIVTMMIRLAAVFFGKLERLVFTSYKVSPL